MKNQSTPSTPASGYRTMYPKTDGWYELDSDGAETKISYPADLSTDPVMGGGYLAWNFDQAKCQGSTVPAANGTVNVMKLWTPRALTSVTNVHLHVGTAGATLTSGQNFAALYTGAKALVGTTADQTTAWGSAGMKTMALSGGPYTLQAGFFYVAMFSNATTRPALARISNFVVNNGLLSAANARWATADTGRTTSMPATLGAFTASTLSFWAGIS